MSATINLSNNLNKTQGTSKAATSNRLNPGYENSFVRIASDHPLGIASE